jgi:hypothetical protein
LAELAPGGSVSGGDPLMTFELSPPIPGVGAPGRSIPTAVNTTNSPKRLARIAGVLDLLVGIFGGYRRMKPSQFI